MDQIQFWASDTMREAIHPLVADRCREYQIFDITGLDEAAQHRQRPGWLDGFVLWKSEMNKAEEDRRRRAEQEAKRPSVSGLKRRSS